MRYMYSCSGVWRRNKYQGEISGHLLCIRCLRHELCKIQWNGHIIHDTVPISSPSPSPSHSPWKSLIYFLSLKIYLFWTFHHINEIMYLYCSLATVNSAAMNRYVRVFVWTPVSVLLGIYIPRSGIDGSCSNFMFNVSRNHQTFSCQFYFSLWNISGMQKVSIIK